MKTLLAFLICLAGLPSLLQARWVAAPGRVLPQSGLHEVAASNLLGLSPVIAEWLVDEGAVVEEGTVLARTQAYAVQLSLVAIAEAQLAATEAAAEALAAGQLEIEHERVALRGEIAVAEATMKAALQAQLQAQAGVRQAEAARELGWARHEAALDKLARQRAHLQKIIDDEDPPRSDRVELQHQQRTLDAEREALQAESGPLRQHLETAVEVAAAAEATAQAEAERAQAVLAQLQEASGSLDARAAQLNADLLRAQRQSAVAAAELARLSAELALAEITAPLSGTLLEIRSRRGEAVGPGGACLLGDLSAVVVEAEVYIDDARLLEIGQKASVTGHAFEGALTGTVVAIDPLVGPRRTFTEDPASFTDQRVVIATIALDDDASAARFLQAQVNARITVAP